VTSAFLTLFAPVAQRTSNLLRTRGKIT